MPATIMRDGYVLQRVLAPGLSTLEVGKALGTIIDVGELLPSAEIKTVQSLMPRNTIESNRNKYSGHFGLGAFPFHSDLGL
jgi:hypothetical protein